MNGYYNEDDIRTAHDAGFWFGVGTGIITTILIEALTLYFMFKY
jgi:hypothetical protein